MTEMDVERVVRVAVVQQAGLASDIAANLDALVVSIDEAGRRGADLVVPTELCLTPYFAAQQQARLEWALEPGGPELHRLATAADRNDQTLVVPTYLRTRPDGGDNVVLVIGPDGQPITGTTGSGAAVDHYTKVHLPQAMPPGSGIDEPHHFEPGRHLPVFDTPVGRIGLLVCYDRRFPEAWRTLALAGAELVAVPSCIPLWNPGKDTSTGDLFVDELAVRATENPLFVVAACRAGDEELDGITTSFIGRSCVVGPGGSVRGEAAPTGDQILIADIDLGVVAKARRRLTVLDDRRPEAYVL